MMKKIHLILFVVFSMVVFSNCKKDEAEEIADPIVGAWENETELTTSGTTTVSVWRWEMKADNTGEYTYTRDGELQESSVLTWKKNDMNYHIDYELEALDDVDVVVSSFLGMTTLETDEETPTILGKKVSE